MGITCLCSAPFQVQSWADGATPPSLIPGSSSTFLQANLLITTNGSTCHLVIVRKSLSPVVGGVWLQEFEYPGPRTSSLCLPVLHPPCLPSLLPVVINASGRAGVLGSWSRRLDPGAPGSEGLASREAMVAVIQPRRPAPSHRSPL